MQKITQQIEDLNREITACRKCSRLSAWCEEVSRKKRAAYIKETYWGKPVPGFGDPEAQILVVGLAPGAHGANRTGRVFTGDRSGDWLYRALYRANLASQPESVSLQDGQQLKNVYISAIVRCAPPANKPLPSERNNCIPYFLRELEILKNIKVVVALGKFAWDGFLAGLQKKGTNLKPRPTFTHGARVKAGKYQLLGSYHPSQQNTFTGRLTEEMLDVVFQKACISLT